MICISPNFTSIAILSSDYSGLPQVLSFSSGQSLSTLSCADVTIIDDDTLENIEVFSIALSTDFPEGVSFSRDRSMVQIIDNEEGKMIIISGNERRLNGGWADHLQLTEGLRARD